MTYYNTLFCSIVVLRWLTTDEGVLSRRRVTRRIVGKVNPVNSCLDSPCCAFWLHDVVQKYGHVERICWEDCYLVFRLRPRNPISPTSRIFLVGGRCQRCCQQSWKSAGQCSYFRVVYMRGNLPYAVLQHFSFNKSRETLNNLCTNEPKIQQTWANKQANEQQKNTKNRNNQTEM